MTSSQRRGSEKFLDPASITSKHAAIVAKAMGLSYDAQAHTWYDWLYERWLNDPLHMEGSIRRRLHEIHDEFARARMRGEL